MNSRRARGQGDVGPVVHQHWYRECLHQSANQLNQLARFRLLQPELHRGNTPPLGGERECNQVASLHQAVVGHQHQA